MKSSRRLTAFLLFIAALLTGCNTAAPDIHSDRPSVAGIYPHLAMINDEGECGTGAVVPWAGRLWVITYAPHKPMDSSDKLYEISPSLEQTIRTESVGGTHANRMIHRPSNQLIMGYHFIDALGKVRTIDPKDMPGRLTANATHLRFPDEKVYFTTMEEGLYEVDVNTLHALCWINDGNANAGAKKFPNAVNSRLPGYHGKGSYTAQGRLIYTNNGERGDAAKKDPTTPSGALAEWGGPAKDWQLVLREQFTEVTGPGGIDGADKKSDPAWALGWDHKSVLLMLLDDGTWHRYRLPKASFTYNGAHGWNTEWPRIREIGEGDDLLATMHGTFWNFPKTFSRNNSAGITPRSNYLKVIGDFARWGDYVVLGCDDSAKKEFLNTRPSKAENGAPLRSNSNLWFVKPDQLEQLGPALGSGGVWLSEDVKADAPSDPFLFEGYTHRMLHLAHQSDHEVSFVIEIDREGNDEWEVLATHTLGANSYLPILFMDESETGAWVRIHSKQDTKGVTAWFHYAQQEQRANQPADIFNGLATANSQRVSGGLIRSLGGDDLPLGMIPVSRGDGEQGFYLLDKQLQWTASDDATRHEATAKAAAPDIEKLPVSIEGNSVLVIEDGRRWRLPLNPDRAQDKPFSGPYGQPRRVREVATERDLTNIAGTFFELPARNAGGFAHIRPIASHPYRIHDFCSWRGLLLLTGVDPDADNDRIIRSEDGKAAVWAGVIDDLWQMGKPVGVGGPWHNTQVKAGEPSDPYLMYGYDKKHLIVESDKKAEVFIQFDPSGTGSWHTLGSLIASPDEKRRFNFYKGVNAHWVRLICDTDATLSATFIYE